MRCGKCRTDNFSEEDGFCYYCHTFGEIKAKDTMPAIRASDKTIGNAERED
jgi:hypothetical protein